MQSLSNYASDEEEPVEERVVERDPLQEKITRFLEKVQSGISLIDNLHSQKQFHNPELLTKIIVEYLDDEYGTNYPPHIYKPIVPTEETIQK
jgi:hypothetical protein